MVMSVGALVDDEFRSQIFGGQNSGSRIFIPSGALTGTDALRSSMDELTTVELRSTKNPKYLPT